MCDKVVDLVFGVAQITTVGGGLQLHVMMPAAREENSYEPAESVTIHGKPAIEKLRVFLNNLEAFDDVVEGGG